MKKKSVGKKSRGMILWVPGVHGTNRRPRLTIPVRARLEDVVDWKHPLLAAAKSPDPATRLLEAWRRDPGYSFFFKPSQISALLRDIPDGEKKAHRSLLEHFASGGTAGEGGHWRIPIRDDGRVRWRCYTRRNQEFVCYVNRFGWILGMAAVARELGAAAQETVFSIIDDWIRSCPVPVALIEWRERPWKYWYHPWAPLNAALRVKYWMFALHLLWDSPVLTPERFGRIVRSLRQHLIYLGRVSTRLDKRASGNHFLMETEALLYASLLPWLRESKSAREAALHNLVRCFDRQILPDGVHCERAPGYHRGCMQWFALPLLLARLNKWPLPRRCETGVAGMLNFGLHSMLPGGVCVKLGDSGANRDGWTSERLLARMIGRELPFPLPPPRNLLPFIRRFPPAARDSGRPFHLARHFPWGGFAAARSSWKDNASAVFMKLDGYGGGHSHGDFLSFVLVLNGRIVVDDRGVWAYDNNWQSVECKARTAHNILMLGDREFLKMDNMSNYFFRRPPDVRVKDILVRTGQNGALRAGGRVVWPDGAWWRRELVFDPRGILRVNDEFRTPADESVRLQFHLREEDWRIASSTECRSSGGNGQPGVLVRVRSKERFRLSLSKDHVCDGHFNRQESRLLTLSTPQSRRGAWTTEFLIAPQ